MIIIYRLPKEKIFKTLHKIQDLDKNYIENYIKNFDFESR